MPNSCYGGDSPDGQYVQKHNPFYYFDTLRRDPASCGRLVPLEALSADLAADALPDLVWVGPNLRDSTHDRSVSTGDRWLANLLPGVLQSPAFREGGLLVVTYDEGRTNAACCGRPAGGGHVMTVVASPLGSRVQQQAEGIGPETVVAQPIGAQGVLEVLDPSLRLAPVDVPVVELERLLGPGGDHEAGVGALRQPLRLEHYRRCCDQLPA